jgi:hypothetical protein
MKKVFVLFVLLFVASINLKAIDVPKTVLHRVSWIDQIGTKEEISKEIKVRQSLIAEYKKDGYTFDKMERTPKGLFMKFVKLN